MPVRDPEVARLRATLAVHTRDDRPDVPELRQQLQEQLRVSRLRERAEALVADWPELNADQKARLAVILRPIANDLSTIAQ